MNTSTDQATALPAGLAGVLNRPDEQRDSAYYSNMDPSSKHTSTQSANGHHGLTPPPSGYPSTAADHTPSPIATNVLSQPLPSPNSGSMSVASMVSPTNDNGMLRKLDGHRQSYESSAGQTANNGDSRRESVTSQLGFGDLRLANSPYASNNQSTTSIQSTLQQQRHPQGVASTRGMDRGSVQRFSGAYTPGAPQSEKAKGSGPKNAPAITGPSDGVIARGPEPTPGQAWAFPEEVVERLPSAARPSAESSIRQGTSFLVDSRRSSTSTNYTTESRLPAGQRRLEDGMPSDYQRQSRASSEFQMSHHHHSLQHKAIGDLQSDAGSPGSTNQPYSRTPELRVSHKLAERKRRTEMKELFDTLRDLMPQERGSKASKWEILTKAIAEYARLHEVIHREQAVTTRVKQDLEASNREVEALRRELGNYQRDNAFLANGHLGRADGSHVVNNPPFGVAPLQPIQTQHTNSGVSTYTSERYAPAPAQQLPPLRINGTSDSMNGIQYHDPNRVSGSQRY